ncbi:T-complex protein 1 subunit theta, partial [Tanacetum coccineum]
LENYGKTKEAKVEELIKAVTELGAQVIVSGAGVGEMALSFYLKAIAKYAKSFKLIPRLLAESTFHDAPDIILSLYREHTSGNVKVGIDFEEDGQDTCKDASTLKIWNLIDLTS